MSEIEMDVDSGCAVFTLHKGRSKTTWLVAPSDTSAEILEALKEILEATGGSVGTAQVQPYVPPAAMFTPPVVDGRQSPVVDVPKVSGVSWDDSAGIDDLPVM